MPATIEAKEHNLGQVFRGDLFFEIPFYQRPYAWTTAEVNDLLSDLFDAMEREDEPYFLGSVVIVKDDDDTKGDVVDGQQRLTTLTIMFCVLRELSSSDESKNLLDSYVRHPGDRYAGIEDRFRLGLKAQDRTFFQHNVQVKGELDSFLNLDTNGYSDSQLRIFQNAKLLKEELGKPPENEHDRLIKYMVRNCYIVVVSASDRDSAHRIFTVLNDRGLDLSPTDILKAVILDKVPEEDREALATSWDGIEEEIGREDFRNLFTHIRMIYRKDKMRESLQKEFEDHIRENLSQQEAASFVDDVLDPYAKLYVAVSKESDNRYPEEVNRLLGHLRELDNRDWVPPAMSYFHRNAGQRDNLTKFTRDLERLAYGLFMRRANINERINRYADVLRAIEQAADLFAESSPLQLSPNEKAEILTRLDGDIYNQPRIPRPLLLRLDSVLTEAGVTYDHPVISVEHVLPQNPAENSYWRQWFDDEQRKRWTHSLANLVLLSRRKNSRASNYEFDRKKQEYFLQNGTTTFALTTNVVAESEWTPQILERRQLELVDTLKGEWRLA